MEDRNIRVLVGKVGLDGHDRGAKHVTSILRDAGMEVVYVPRFQAADAVITAAVQEDVDVVGLSFLSGEYVYYLPRIVSGLKAEGLGDVLIIVGGLIRDADIPFLRELGVKGIFKSGATKEEIVGFIKSQVAIPQGDECSGVD